MNWIEIEQNIIIIAGYGVEIDVRADGIYHAATRGAHDGYQQVEPDEPAAFEILAVEFRTSKRDAVTGFWVPTSEWRPIPVDILLPTHMDAIAEQCVDYYQDQDQREREDAAEARRAT